MTCIKTGARVHLLAYDTVFAADLFEVAGAIVVKANGPIVHGKNAFKSTADGVTGIFGKPTHVVHDLPEPTYWAPEMGLFVVPKAQCVEGVR